MSCSYSNLIIANNHNPQTKGKKVKIKDGWVEYSDKSSMLNFKSIHRFLNFISGLRNSFGAEVFGIEIRFPNMEADDKLSIQILESVIYSLISDYKYSVSISMKMFTNILTEGVKYSPLQHLTKADYSEDRFIKEYESQMNLRHYRKIVPREWSYTDKLGSNVFLDVYDTLFHQIENKDFAQALAEVSTELVNNANEHNDSDCILDLDISDNYVKTDESEGIYYAINLTVVSFSNITLSDHLYSKITKGDYNGSRYDTVAEAYENHKSFFTEKYRETDFFMAASFQDKITGRKSCSSSGGTGLTRLIQMLEEYADSSKCYVVSDNRALYFLQDLLSYDENGWIGFNKENDFRNYPPETGTMKDIPINIPGVAYNLSFVCKKGEEHEYN